MGGLFGGKMLKCIGRLIRHPDVQVVLVCLRILGLPTEPKRRSVGAVSTLGNHNAKIAPHSSKHQIARTCTSCVERDLRTVSVRRSQDSAQMAILLAFFDVNTARAM